MGTNCALCIREHGVYKAINVSNDGYPDHMLPILNSYYTTKEKVKQLMNGGNLRVIYPIYEPDVRGYHTLNDSQPNVSIVYIREINTQKELAVDKDTNEIYTKEYQEKFLMTEVDIDNIKEQERFKFAHAVYLYNPDLQMWNLIPSK